MEFLQGNFLDSARKLAAPRERSRNLATYYIRNDQPNSGRHRSTSDNNTVNHKPQTTRLSANLRLCHILQLVSLKIPKKMSLYLIPSSYYSPREEEDMLSSLLNMGRGMREMDRSFGDVFSNLTSMSPCARERGDVGFSDARVDNPVVTDKDGNRRLNFRFDVRQFKPEEINVKSYDDGRIEVSATHETKDDHHHLYREYRRTCRLPEGVKLDTVKSHLHPSGVLVVEAPLPAIEAPKPQPQARNEPIPIGIEHQGGEAKSE